MAVNTRAVLLLESDGGLNDTLVATRPMRIYDFHIVVTNAGNGGNVCTLRRDSGGGYQNVSAALVTSDVAGSLGTPNQRTASLALAEDDVAVGDSLQLTNSGGDGTGRCIGYIKIIPRPITGA